MLKNRRFFTTDRVLYSIVLIIFVTLPYQGAAQEEPRSYQGNNFKDSGKLYVEVKGGGAKPLKLKGEFTGSEIKDVGLFEIRGGYSFEDFGIDLTLSQGARSKIFKQNLNSTPELLVYSNNTPVDFKHYANLLFTSLMVSGYYNVTEIHSFKPYVGLGAGVSRNKVSQHTHYANYDFVNEVGTPGTYHYNQTTEGATKYNLAYQAMVGTLIKIKPNFWLSLEYKYMDLGKFSSSNAYILADGSSGIGARKTSPLRVNCFLLGVRYDF